MKMKYQELCKKRIEIIENIKNSPAAIRDFVRIDYELRKEKKSTT